MTKKMKKELEESDANVFREFILVKDLSKKFPFIVAHGIMSGYPKRHIEESLLRAGATGQTGQCVVANSNGTFLDLEFYKPAYQQELINFSQ